jgi:hypothetical protein
VSAYADGVLAAVLRAANVVPAVGSDTRVYTRLVPDLAARMPCVVVRTVAGGAMSGPLGDTMRDVPWQVEAWTADTGDAGRYAQSIAAACVKALLAAAMKRVPTSDGWITACPPASIVAPYDAAAEDASPTGVCRWRATGLAGFRSLT